MDLVSVQFLEKSNVIRAMVLAAVFFLTLLLRLSLMGDLAKPPSDDDGIYHETLAANVYFRGEFGGWVDERIKAPYLQYLEDERYGGIARFVVSGQFEQLLIKRGMSELTTFRPPAYIYLLAASYRVFGRHFALAHILNALYFAFGAFLCVLVFSPILGIKTVYVFLGILLVDATYLRYCRLVLTESLAFLAVSAIFCFLATGSAPLTLRRGVFLGVLLGAAALTRPVYVFCSPVLACVPVVGRGLKQNYRQAAVFVLAAVLTLTLIILPWAVRNVILLQAPMPTGVQGPMLLGMVYNDQAINNYGNWTAEKHSEFFNSYKGEEVGLARERALAKFGSERAKDWIIKNWYLVPVLMLLRLYSFWFVHTSVLQMLWIGLSLFALIKVVNRQVRIAAIGIFLSYSISIAITINVANGRFLMALYPVFHVLSASTLVWMVQTVAKIARR